MNTGVKSTHLERESQSGGKVRKPSSAKSPNPNPQKKKTITISSRTEKVVNNSPQSQNGNLIKDDFQYSNNADQAKQVKVKAAAPSVNPNPNPNPTLPKDENTEDPQETIKLLQLKVQKMSELLELKNEKLVKLESNHQLKASFLGN